MNNQYEADKAQRASIVRYAALILVIVNAILTMFNMPIIPAEYADIVASGLIAIVGLYVGFKNNYLTRRGKKQAEELEQVGLLKK